jgi:NAD(P)-dependent dehydrogenase (short-subunit alcohol dehydrogenase family)
MTSNSPGARPVAVITGASRGLGETLSRFLAGQGYDLVLNARGRTALEAVASQLRRVGHDVYAAPGDVTDPATRESIRTFVSELGRLDLLVNNASELGPTPLPNLAVYAERDLEWVFRVNVMAPLALIQTLLPALRAHSGRVVNISSDAARGGYPGWGGYGASKAALDLVSLTLAQELSGSGVSVISVDPGDMRTAMHQAAYPGVDITDRPPPDATLPFWAWVLSQDASKISGHRFQAQADRWEVPL